MRQIKREVAEFQIRRLHRMLINILEGPKIVPGVDMFSVEANEQSLVSRSDLERCLYANYGSGLLGMFTVTN